MGDEQDTVPDIETSVTKATEAPSFEQKQVQHELRLVRAALKAIKAGNQTPTAEVALDLIGRSPLIEAVRMWKPTDIEEMFSRKGTGGVTLFGKAPLNTLAEYSAEDTRETADFSELFPSAAHDPYIYDLLDKLVKVDISRPGLPNASLLAWVSCKPEKRPSLRDVKRVQLRWRNALLVWLINDARTLGFPVEGGHGSGAITARFIVAEVVRKHLGQTISVRQLLRIWDDNKERIPEMYRH